MLDFTLHQGLLQLYDIASNCSDADNSDNEHDNALINNAHEADSIRRIMCSETGLDWERQNTVAAFVHLPCNEDACSSSTS